jgi:phage N-6-adenine-methyltransferase
VSMLDISITGTPPSRIGREPIQKPGRSKQDYGTPPEFLAAITRRFGPIDLDLACRPDNMVAPYGITEEIDSLAQDWADPMYWSKADNVVASGDPIRVAFLNPPFSDIRPWAAKCESCRWLPRWTVMLVPASMGSLWWRDHVLGKCQADGTTRMKFVGATDLYPKDLAVLSYGYGVAGSGFWDWRP